MEHAPVCSCVLVSGLKDDTTDDTVNLYFENKRSCGNAVSKIERTTKSSALVYFEEPSSKKTLTFFILNCPKILVSERHHKHEYKCIQHDRFYQNK